MQMWVILKHKLELGISLLILGGAGLFTVFACAKWGVETGSSFGILAFLLAGGAEAAWYLMTRRLERRVDEQLELDQISKSYKASEDNPTIR